MRFPAILAATALVSSTILSTPAYAVDISPDATVEPDQVMFQGYCDDHYVTDDLHYVEAIAGSIVAGTATEVPNSRQDLEETRVGDPSSTITYSGLLGVGGPLVRIGGSPNLFATGTYSTKNYSGSFVDQTALFSHRDAYNFDCRYWTDTVTTTTDPGGSDPNNPGVGNCVGDPNKKDAIDGVGPGQGAANANPHSACASGGLIYHHDWNYVDYPYTFYFTPEAESQTFLHVSEPNVPVSEMNGPYTPGDWYGAACISPSNTQTGKKGNPGTWRTVNNYQPSANCTSMTQAVFYTRPTVFGHEFSDPIPSNSLP